MKKMIFILIVTFLPFFANAWEACGTDGKGNTANCEYQIVDGTLTIRGTGENGNIGWWRVDNYTYAYSPWAGQTFENIIIEDSIKDLGYQSFYGSTCANTIIIPDSVQKISNDAFKNAKISGFVLPDGITSIGGRGFSGTPITEIEIPDTVTQIGINAFANTKKLNSLVIPDGVTSIGDGVFNGSSAVIYCAATSPCEGKGSENIVPYQREGGVYVLGGKYYLTATDMAGGTNTCNKELNECKRDVLEAKGICQGSSCDTFIQSDGNYMLKYDGKTYQNINALLRGDYDRRRIYTIEEANFVAGDKNRVSITYR